VRSSPSTSPEIVPLSREGPGSQSNPQRGLDQILFDLTRTRLTLQHLLDHQVGSEATDQIRQTAQQEAERYMQRLRRRTI
jgi:hypothetical protein